jgi:hypothetical protein
MKRSLLSLLAMLILSTAPLNADIGPGPSPEDRETIQVPFSDLEKANPGQTDSASQADVAPQPPAPQATSPVPMVIAGLAATAGVALLGLWIAKKGRSGDAQVQ